MISTKENILITALHLFAKDGYEAVSVSQIAGSLNMTKGALYRHYKSKRDMILRLQSLAVGYFALRKILIFMERVALKRQVSLVSDIMV